MNATQTVVISQQDCAAYLQTTNQTFGVAVFSPPYNNSTAYDTYQDKLPVAEYLRNAWVLGIMLERRMVAQGTVFLNLGPNRTSPQIPWKYLARFCEGGHWKVQNQIIWVKAATTLSDDGTEFNYGHHRPNRSEALIWSGWEWVFQLCRTVDYPVALDRLALGVPYSDKSNLKRFGHERDLRCRGNVWEIPYECNQSRQHPASFPPELPWRCLQLAGPGLCQQGVLDPYCGVGNTGIAAARLGAPFHGVDISPDYCLKALENYRENRT